MHACKTQNHPNEGVEGREGSMGSWSGFARDLMVWAESIKFTRTTMEETKRQNLLPDTPLKQPVMGGGTVAPAVAWGGALAGGLPARLVARHCAFEEVAPQVGPGRASSS